VQVAGVYLQLARGAGPLAVMASQGGAGVLDFEAWKRRVSKIDDSWQS